MIPTITKEWVFTEAQTDFLMEAVAAAERMVSVYAKATCANSNEGDVALRMGFAAATLPTITNNSATGGLGVFMSHPGIAHGGGIVESNGGAPIAVGGIGEDLRMTCSAAAGGALRIVVTYWIDDLS